MKKIRKILIGIFLFILLLLLGVWLFIRSEWGQNFIVDKATKILSKELNTTVTIDHVRFSLFNNLHLNGLVVLDQKKDSLLYAGEVKVHINDWFFLKDHIDLKYIELNDALVNINRKDSVWNYQFIIDYFDSGSSNKPKEDSKSIELNLKTVHFTNLRLIQKDAWAGQNMIASIVGFHLYANRFDLANKNIGIENITLEKLFFKLEDYVALKPPSTNSVKKAPDTSDTIKKAASKPWEITAKSINLSNSVFALNTSTSKPIPGVFDAAHILFSDITASFKNLRLFGDSLTAALDLKTKERSGFDVKKMKADVLVTSREMTFKKLQLVANNSTISDYYSMKYKSIDDMGDFLNKVTLEGNFNKTYIATDDLAFFAPELKSWKKNITIDGRVRGPISNLVGKGLNVQAGKNTLLNGDLSMVGLPNIDETYIDLDAKDFTTTYADIISFAPQLKEVKKPNLKKLQYIKFKGFFTGFISDFVTYGTVHTALGSITSDLNMKLPTKGVPTYSGSMHTTGFKIGEFLNDTLFNSISINGKVKGAGFSLKQLNSKLNAQIKYFDYNGYRYQNIAVDGNILRKNFDGFASISDTAVKLSLNGVLDFNKTVPTLNILAKIEKINLKQLNLTQENLSVKGNFDLNFTGSNIDNFIGSARLQDVELYRDSFLLPLNNMLLTSELIGNEKLLTVKSNEFDAKVMGQFTIEDIPNAAKQFLNKYYPTYITPPDKKVSPQKLNFEITTYNVEEILKLFDSTVTGFNYSHIFGNLNTATSELNLTADIPLLKYQQYKFEDVELVALGNREHLTLKTQASNINVSDSFYIPKLSLSIAAQNDTSDVNINFGANQNLNSANVNAQVFTFDNGVRIVFDPTTFTVNDKTWHIEDNGELEFRSNVQPSGQLVLREGNQEVKLFTRINEQNKWNDLVVQMRSIILSDFSAFILPDTRLEGLLNADVLVEDLSRNLKVSSEDVLVKDFRLDNDSIGDIRSKMHFDKEANKIVFEGLAGSLKSGVSFDGNIFLNKGEDVGNRIKIKSHSLPLSLLQRFLSSIFSNIRGTVTGDWEIKGALADLNILGEGLIEDAGLRVNSTNCTYFVNKSKLKIAPTSINLGGIVLKDSVSGNPIYLSGEISHKNFKDIFYDIMVSTVKPGSRINDVNNKPVLVLNTKANGIDPFYGKVFATGSFALVGFENDLQMHIAGTASSKDSSIVVLPPSNSKAGDMPEYLVEKKYGTEQGQHEGNINQPLVSYFITVTANPMLIVKVVLDELTGDKVEGRGSGTLSIKSATGENLSMNGRFEIFDGEYLYTLPPMYKKPFKIIKGDNYILWNGDPYKARINLNARYAAHNVSFKPLASDLGFDKNSTNIREDVYVVANLSGDLFSPAFKLKIDLPADSKLKNDFSIATNFEQMLKSPSELTRQAGSLLFFGAFLSPETNQGSSLGIGSALNELGYSTISSFGGLFFNKINNRLNDELSKVFKNNKLSVNFDASVYNRNALGANGGNTGFNPNQSNFNLNVRQPLLNGRLNFVFDGNLDVPIGSSLEQTIAFLPDVSLEYLITPSGSVRTNLFYKQNLDFLTTSATGAARTNRLGGNLTYQKEFNNLKEFFSDNKPKREKNVLDTTQKNKAVH